MNEYTIILSFDTLISSVYGFPQATKDRELSVSRLRSTAVVETRQFGYTF